MTITQRDIRAAGYCSRGVRAWFARHGFDYMAFLREGIAAERLLATGDPLARAVVEAARGRS